MAKRTRENILSTAQLLFGEKGFHQTTVDDIISAAGTGKGSFYNYFKNKQDIFELIVNGIVDEVIESVTSISLDDIVDEESYHLVTLRVGTGLAQVFAKNRVMAKIFFREAVGLNSKIDSALHSAYERVTDVSARYIEKGQEVGVIRNDIAPRIMAMGAIGMIVHFINQYLQEEIPEATINDMVHAIISMHLQGVLKR